MDSPMPTHDPSDTTGFVFDSLESLRSAREIAEVVAQSTMIPLAFQKNVPNILVAMDFARRTSTNLLAVMRGIKMIEGEVGLSASFVVTLINSHPRFKNTEGLEYRYTGLVGKLDRTAIGFIRLANGEILEGPAVSLKMALEAGWTTRPGSLWKAMGEVMLTNRAATFFGRRHIPERMLGLSMVEEIGDRLGVPMETGFSSSTVPHEGTPPSQPSNGTAESSGPNGSVAQSTPTGAPSATAGLPRPLTPSLLSGRIEAADRGSGRADGSPISLLPELDSELDITADLNLAPGASS